MLSCPFSHSLVPYNVGHRKILSSVFLSLCSLVISCSGRLMLSPCVENLYTQQELVGEID